MNFKSLKPITARSLPPIEPHISRDKTGIVGCLFPLPNKHQNIPVIRRFAMEYFIAKPLLQ